MIEQLFFELIQIAIGNRKELRHIPSIKEWQELFDMAKKQALTAIAFMGVTKLTPVSDFGTSLGIPEEVYLKWLGLTAKVAQRNKELNAECAKVCAELAYDGLQCCVLKGQSNLVNYPEELRECRTAGDIDLWTLPANQTGIARVIEYAQQWRISHNQEPIHWDRILYYHVEIETDSGIEVELHYRPSFLCSPIRNHRLQRWFKENEQFGMCDFAPEFPQGCQARLCKFPIPTVSFNVVYQLLHIYKHLFEEGIGLRQLLDYYFVLKALEESKQTTKEDIMHTLSRFGMSKFAGAVMYVIAKVFANDDDNGASHWPWMICEPDEKEGKFLLSEIMQAGNFGAFDQRIKRGYGLWIMGYGFNFPKGMVHAIEKTKHNLRLLYHYPEEVLWEPVFRMYHWVWRKLELWRY